MSPDHERRRRLLARVDTSGRRGLEIGALANPVLEPGTPGVLFADRVSTAELRALYAGHERADGLDLSRLVPVDVVIGDGTVAAALGSRGPVDYVVASHVIEHVADPTGWLRDLSDCLVEGGLLWLVVPDKRFTFDHFRAPTTLRELLEAHLGGWRRPSPGQVYDAVAHGVPVEPLDVWRGRPIRRPPPAHAQALALARSAAAGAFHDTHCTVWTPGQFAGVVGALIAADLVPLEFARLEPTPLPHLEFYVTLRKRSSATAAERSRTIPRLGARHRRLPGFWHLAALRLRLRRWARRSRRRPAV